MEEVGEEYQWRFLKICKKEDSFVMSYDDLFE